MLSGRNGGKGKREQYFEGIIVLTLVMCSKWNSLRRKLMCSGNDGGETAAPHAADMR
jgi:hypothetical protein